MTLASLPGQVEVVVVGAGLAGHAAALAAADLGAEVCLVEKTPHFGGSSVQAVGSFAFAGTDLQREAQVEDDIDLLRRDMLKSGEGKQDPILLQLLLDQQLDAYHWLRTRGVRFSYSKPAAPGSALHIHTTPAAQAVNALHDRLMANPRIRYVPGAGATRLLRKASNVAVDGIEFESGADRRTVQASAGVVLATGGFSRSLKMIRAFAPGLLEAIKLGGRGNTGDGLKMANALGAGLADMGWVSGTFGVALLRYPDLEQHPDDLPGLLFSFYSGAVIVNLAGRRFADESANYKALGGLCAAQPKSIAFQLFDQKTMAMSRAASAHNFQAAYERGEIRRADSLRSLATELGIDSAALEETIARYNRDADSGTDTDFGRKIPMKIDQAPFYAYPCGVAVTTTFCGLTVDSDMRVLDVFGEPVAGLWASGEMVAGFHGSTYMSGTALTKAAVTGRIAGANAARATVGCIDPPGSSP